MMRSLSVILLLLAFALALVFGAQAESWSWGPALLALSAAVAAGLAGAPARGRGLLVGVPLVVAAAWILLRCFQSPVLEFARSDALLVLSLLAVAWVVSGLEPGGGRMRWLHFGLALTVLGNLVVAAVQVANPEFTWPYAARPTDKPTGFFGHYNYFANYVGTAGLLLLGRALLSRDPAALRVGYGALFAGAAVMIWQAESRGGLLTLGIGGFVGVVGCGLVAWRRKSRWLPALVIVAPLLLVASGLLGMDVLRGVQERRFTQGDLVDMVDNTSRLEWMDLALRVSQDHPLLGGGSRSYSWERNHHWDPEDFGPGIDNERFVHNELLQLATDYGWLGALLVLLALFALCWSPFSGLVLGAREGREGRDSDALNVGVLAASVATLAQANVSFVFHLLPGVLMLGLLFGLALAGRQAGGVAARAWPRRVAGALVLVPLAGFGWNASRALHQLWPVFYAQRPLWVDAPETAMRRLESASRVWPGFRVLQERANIARSVSAKPGLPADEVGRWNEEAVEAYRLAAERHPYHPGLALNLANAASELGQDEEAEHWYGRAAELEGGLEPAFRARFCHAAHVTGRADALWRQRRPSEALAGFRRALGLLDESDALTPAYLRKEDSVPLRKKLEDTVRFLEAAGIR